MLLTALAALSLAGGPRPCEVAARTDPPAPKAEPATIDQLVRQLADLRAQKAELEKREKATLAELKERLKVLRDLLNELDVEPKPPEPKPPEPKPPAPPTPRPVTSFRVLFVVESANTLTAAQHAVVYARSVRDYLGEATTPEGGRPGWRLFDKDADAGNEPPTVKALWAAVRPQVTAVPCVAIEVNGAVTIEPLPETPVAAVALFKKYREGK